MQNDHTHAREKTAALGAAGASGLAPERAPREGGRDPPAPPPRRLGRCGGVAHWSV